jgi:hypothetical protein
MIIVLAPLGLIACVVVGTASVAATGVVTP